MAVVEKILVPVDFSECSWAALDCAAAFSRSCGAPVELMHVWESATFVEARQEESATTEQARLELFRRTADGGADLERFADALRQMGAVEVVCRLETGDPCDCILSIARDGFDLIVMGTHGRTGLAHLLLGSVAEKVMRRACCPVVTVRQPQHQARSRGWRGTQRQRWGKVEGYRQSTR